MEADISQHIDEQILELMNSGNGVESGMRLLMDTYQERLYRHIRGLVKSHQDTDDVLQNTFIKVYRHIARFKGESRLYTWLYRIATNESLTLLRRNQSKRMIALDDQLGHEAEPVAEAQLPADQIQQVLQQALEVLPEKQRAVFQLRYFDEMSYAQMNEVTGTSVGALKASYHHAVKKIEAFLKKAQL